VVLFLKKMIFHEKIPNTAKDNILNNTPIFFVEKGSETIWPWCFCRSYA
jgi:hypothetical protein